ncbi:MAG: YIP1 family protein [Defluviitaleaceae bacterium]|nr:YIP1 family protein [Defluviitaleaceae bacterium]
MNDQQNEPTQVNNEQPHEEITRMVAPDAPKMGIVNRLINIFVSPVELMQNIKLHPVILVPLLTAILITLVAIPISTQLVEISNRELTNISIERYGMDVFGLTADADIYGDMDNGASTFTLVTSIATALFMPPFMSFISALGLWILSKILRGSTTLGQMFSMYLHVYVLLAVASVLVSWLMVTTGNLLDVTSLAALLMPNGNISMFSFNMLSYISIFNIWATVLTYLGVKIINDISAVKAAIITAIAFIVGAIITAGLPMLTFVMMDLAMTAM